MHSRLKRFKSVQMKGSIFLRGNECEIAKIHWQYLKISSRTAGLISTKLGRMHPWMIKKGTQVCSNKEPLNSHKVNNGVFFYSLNQHYYIIICELFPQVSDVAHGPLVLYHFSASLKLKTCVSSCSSGLI